MDEGTPLRLGAVAGLHAHAVLAQLGLGAVTGLVVAERREQDGLAGELAQLHRGHGAAAGRLLERARGVDDLAVLRHVGHLRELAPLHVAHHRCAHRGRACHDRPLA
jgi:hypothetical protein